MQGAFETGVYPNRFAAFGHGEAQVRQRLDEVFQQMFYGPEDVRLYHPAGEDMGYLEDTGNHDVRTEGMSYGRCSVFSWTAGPNLTGCGAGP